MAKKPTASPKKSSAKVKTSKRLPRGGKKSGKEADLNQVVTIADVSKLPDRRAIENIWTELMGEAFDDNNEEITALDRAQDIMYDAWETSSRKKRIELAQQALKISADCADAYVLLAQEEARSLTEATDLYCQGVAAGERALGPDLFEEGRGHFWGIIETRPYMRARAGLAQCLWEAGQHEEALKHYQEMLQLNPDDNQGIRYLLMPWLMELNRDLDAEKLFQEYSDDGMATWLYSRVLLDFRKKGDSSAARKALEVALEANNQVPEYLLGRKKMPKQLPAYYGFGDDNEAVLYVSENETVWKMTPGALAWLATQTQGN